MPIVYYIHEITFQMKYRNFEFIHLQGFKMKSYVKNCHMADFLIKLPFQRFVTLGTFPIRYIVLMT